MIRPCQEKDFEQIYEIINDAAQAYKGIIPEDRWQDPYMSKEKLTQALQEGVVFFGFEQEGHLIGVMGIQYLDGVTLIRHAYVRTSHRQKGAGGALLSHLKTLTDQTILIGTWASAHWAIRFYQKHGFVLVPADEKNRLLRKYWTIPERQVETSVVLKEVT